MRQQELIVALIVTEPQVTILKPFVETSAFENSLDTVHAALVLLSHR